MTQQVDSFFTGNVRLIPVFGGVANESSDEVNSSISELFHKLAVLFNQIRSRANLKLLKAILVSIWIAEPLEAFSIQINNDLLILT